MNREIDSFPGIEADEWRWLLVNYTSAQVDPRRAAQPQIFERAYTDLVKVLDNLPRSTKLDQWWLSETGQFFAELLWNTSREEDRFAPADALEHLWGSYTAEGYQKLLMRLKRAWESGRLRRFRVPEERMKRRKDSALAHGHWWFYGPDLDKFREAMLKLG